MSLTGAESSESVDKQKKDATTLEKQSIDVNNESEGFLVMENGSYNAEEDTSDNQDKLVQMVVELNFQNEYLKSQFIGLKNIHFDSNGPTQQKEAEDQENGDHDAVKELQGQVASLRQELLEERQTRDAAEEALKHLRAVYSEADAKAQELSAKLTEGYMFLFISKLVIHIVKIIGCDLSSEFLYPSRN